MINLDVVVEATAKLDPTQWDTAGGAEVTLRNAVRSALAAFCGDVEVEVKVSVN